MPRFAEPVRAPLIRKPAPAMGGKQQQPRKTGPQRGAIWHAIQLKAARSAVKDPSPLPGGGGREADGIIQCYGVAGGFKFSQNLHYATESPQDSMAMYVCEDKAVLGSVVPAVPRLSQPQGTRTLQPAGPSSGAAGAASAAASSSSAAAARPNAITYRVHTPSIKVLQDCAHAMEEIMHQRQLNEGYVVSEFVSTKSSKRPAFGDTPEGNQRRGARKGIDQGTAANPVVGQGYVIVRQSGEGTAHHGAAVVAKDGADDVTMETTREVADNEKPRRVDPTYDMYGRADAGQSFWHRWATKKGYGKEASVSVVTPKAALPAGAAVAATPAAAASAAAPATGAGAAATSATAATDGGAAAMTN
jgi:hypothetical protein